MIYYDIASKWQQASDEEVELFKNYFVEKTGIEPLTIRGVLCQKEWMMGTYIEVYVAIFDADKTLHYRIDKDDYFSNASSEDY